jgi:hypothetical protein
MGAYNPPDPRLSRGRISPDSLLSRGVCVQKCVQSCTQTALQSGPWDEDPTPDANVRDLSLRLRFRADATDRHTLAGG